MKYLSRIIGLNRMLCAQILFAGLAFVLMAVLSYAFMSSTVRGSLARNATGVLDFAENDVSQSRTRFEASLDYAAGHMREIVLDGGTADDLRAYIENISQFTFLDGSDTTGIRDFYGYFENVPGGPSFIHNTLPDVRSEEFAWYESAAEAGGVTVETVPHTDANGDTCFTYAKAIFDERGLRLGVVCLDVKIDAIGECVISTALNQGGYGFLINQDGVTLFHPNEAFEGKVLEDAALPYSEYAEDLRKGLGVTEAPLISYKGEPCVVFIRVLDNGWYLGLATPKAQYYQSIRNMALALGVLGATLACVLIGILIRLDRARAKSDEESRQKSMFLANMSHEIRTPINAIVGMTALGRAAGTVDRKDYCFSKIDDASKHLLGVINDVLDMSKIEANKIELSETEFNFEKMLRQVINVISFKVDEKEQKFSVYIDKNIPKMLIADDQRFAQVITNLLNNANKFTPEKGVISLKTAYLGEADGLCRIKVEVSDTGIGVSKEQLSKLFHPFQQAESATTRKYGGTGLGLAISKRIVELMGGEIWVDSEPDKGTTIGFTVSAGRGDESKYTEEYKNINWGNIRILTVDDEPDVLEYFKEITASFGSDCDVAGDAAQAVDKISRGGAYDIYFLDLKMPCVDGIELTRRIRSMEESPGNAIVIMISSADLGAVESEAKAAGVNKFLMKPLFPSAIADAISECIGVVKDREKDMPADIEGIFKGHRILFAEDNEINREIVLSIFEPTQLQLDAAANGLIAVELFRENYKYYDMILMDIQMPELDGYDATRRIRGMNVPNAKTIPIVAMTANVFKEDIAKCLEAGMDSHLGKPLDMNDLLDTTKKYLL